MTSKIVVNNIEADSGINTITFINEVTAPTFNGNIVGTAATFTTGTFSGNVDIAGALTYEDVTNVDSVGIVTARSGIHVTGGNVGIGTDNPTSDLQVVSYADHGKIRVESSGNGNRAGIEFFRESSAGTGKGAAGIWVESETGNTTGELRFGTANNASLQSFSTKMILNVNGNLGIGTDNPGSNKLQVQGSSAFYGNGGASATWGDTSYLGALSFDGSAQPVIRAASSKALIFQVNQSTEALRITSSGRVVVGDDTERNNYDNGSVSSNLLHVERTAASGNAGISICANAGTAADVGAILYMGRTSATSNGGNTIVENNDLIGRISFQGADGSQLVEAAAIRVDVDGTPGANDMPGRIEFHTTPDGSSSPTERLRITSDGAIAVGNASQMGSNYARISIDCQGRDVLTDVTDITKYGLAFHNDPNTNDANGIGFFNDDGQACGGYILHQDKGSNNLGDLIFGTSETSNNPEERLRITSAGRILIGRTTSLNDNIAGTGYPNLVQIEGNGTGEGLVVANAGGTARLNIYRKYTPSDGDSLGHISFGSEPNTSVERARIECKADFTNANARGGELLFYTCGNGGYIPTERLRINRNGTVLLSQTNDNDRTSKLYVSGVTESGNIFIGKVHDSTNTNNRTVLLQRMVSGQGFQFSGKFIVNSYTGNAMVDCHITVHYQSQNVEIDVVNATRSSQVAKTNLRVVTAVYGSNTYLGIQKNGGGTGVSYINAMISGNINGTGNGGIREVNNSSLGSVTNHGNLN